MNRQSYRDSALCSDGWRLLRVPPRQPRAVLAVQPVFVLLDCGHTPPETPAPPLEPAALADWGAAGLTPREREVAALIAQGLSNRAVAERLIITRKTAANHAQRVFDKLALNSRRELIVRAYEKGWTRPLTS